MEALTIDPTAPLAPSEDYAALRQTAFTAVERLAHEHWTDYNHQDPGITLLESFVYALTETGYRGQFDLADLLTGPGGGIDHRQPFFTARHILSNAPVTNDDYRRLLIDSFGLSNAWAFCKNCACGPVSYAECADDELSAAPRWRLALPGSNRAADTHEHPVVVRGFTDLLLQFAPDPVHGNLNHHRLDGRVIYPGEPTIVFDVELRFPDWRHLSHAAYEAITHPGTRLDTPTADTITRFSRDRTLDEDVDNTDFRRGIRDIFFLDLHLEFTTHTGERLALDLHEVTLRCWTGASIPNDLDPQQFRELLFQGDLFARYLAKLQRRVSVLTQSKQLVHANRKVGEDFCRCDFVQAEDVSVCADLHLAPTADVEATLAEFYHALSRLLNPQVPFRTLEEMENLGLPTEDIFTGPPLQQGFITQDDLDRSQLRERLYVSDLLNVVMDIPGVVGIEALRFTVYDGDGRPVAPAHEWCIPISPGHYPQLYRAASDVSVYKEGLPLMPRRSELDALLAQLAAADRAVALPAGQIDYPVPTGTYRPAPAYLPAQQTLPAIYGLGVEGPPPGSDTERLARIRQLAEYLLPLETITATTARMLTNVGDLFSSDESVTRTYPAEFLPETLSMLTAGESLDGLEELMEPQEVYLDRRNRLLDHVLARFGESLADYTLLLRDATDRLAFDARKLIDDKVRFLRFLPEISGRRGTGFNYLAQGDVCAYTNRGGLEERLRRLLGLEDIRAGFGLVTERSDEGWTTTFEWSTADGTTLLRLHPELRRPSDALAPGIHADTPREAERRAWEVIREVIELALWPGNYHDAGDGQHEIRNAAGEAMALLGDDTSPEDLQALVSAAITAERIYVIEHILLRSKFPGDALLPVCLAEDCDHQGLEDPYSFRLTYVLPATTEPFDSDMELRLYADRLIRRETPAHLLPKICWVGDTPAASEYTEDELEELRERCICPPPDELARQMSRFEAVYCSYLNLNKSFDWTELNDELRANLLTLLPATSEMHTAELLLGYYGEAFRRHLAGLAADNADLPMGTDATWSDAVWTSFTDFLLLIRQNDSDTYDAFGLEDAPRRAAVRELLESYYADWLDVSFRLHRLLGVFSQLRSAYPEATLHDCDDGDDDSPVRLDQTSLGTL